MTSVDLRYLEPRRWRRLAVPYLFERGASMQHRSRRPNVASATHAATI
jgi:hypothetical protein